MNLHGIMGKAEPHGSKAKQKVWVKSCLLDIDYNTLSCNHGNYHLVIMHRLHNHVYFYEGHTDQNAPLLGKFRCTSPLTAIAFCQVSPNPMAVPKPILLHLTLCTQSADLCAYVI